MASRRRSSGTERSPDTPDKHLGSVQRSAVARSIRTLDAVLVQAVLQEPNAEKARTQYLKALGLDDIDDQGVHDLLQDHVFNAIMRDEPTVEIERDLAQLVLLLVKGGMKRPKGGQRMDRWQEMQLATLVGIGRQTKARLVAEGMNATEAHLQAAEDAAEEARKHGLHYTAAYLAREMQRAQRRR